jgi:hypothetical protein
MHSSCTTNPPVYAPARCCKAIDAQRKNRLIHLSTAPYDYDDDLFLESKKQMKMEEPPVFEGFKLRQTI